MCGKTRGWRRLRILARAEHLFGLTIFHVLKERAICSKLSPPWNLLSCCCRMVNAKPLLVEKTVRKVVCIFHLPPSVLQIKHVWAGVLWATQVQRILWILHIASPNFSSTLHGSCQYSHTHICTLGSGDYPAWAPHVPLLPQLSWQQLFVFPTIKSWGLRGAGAGGRMRTRPCGARLCRRQLEGRKRGESSVIPSAFHWSGEMALHRGLCSLAHFCSERTPSPICQGRDLTWVQMHLTIVSPLSEPLLVLW